MATDVPSPKPVVFTHHARVRMHERGVTEDLVREALRLGRREPAQRGLAQYRFNVEFNRQWGGRYYGVQQVVPIVDEEADRIVVLTVYTFYFQEGKAR